MCSLAYQKHFNATHSSHSEITNWQNEALKFAGKLDTTQLGWKFLHWGMIQ